MSLPFFEGSRSKGTPVDLYFFQYGPAPLDFYAFTNAEQVIQLGNDQYQPTPITRDKIVSSGSLDNSTLSIRTRFDNPVAELFRVYPPSHPISLIIYSGHANDPDQDFRAIWNGRILGVSWEGYEASLSGELISSSRRRPGLRRNYQYGCPHVLYGQGPGKCNANKAAATFTKTVESVAAPTVVMPTGWVPAAEAERFNNGMIEWDRPDGQREVRTILRVENERELVLSGPPTALEAGSTVDVIYGCAHTMEACLFVHNNILNYGGCPWIPTKNPMGPGNQFY